MWSLLTVTREKFLFIALCYYTDRWMALAQFWLSHVAFAAGAFKVSVTFFKQRVTTVRNAEIAISLPCLNWPQCALRLKRNLVLGTFWEICSIGALEEGYVSRTIASRGKRWLETDSPQVGGKWLEVNSKDLGSLEISVRVWAAHEHKRVHTNTAGTSIARPDVFPCLWVFMLS